MKKNKIAKKNELKTAADIKFLEWWFCRNNKEAKKIYEDYLVLVREHNAISGPAILTLESAQDAVKD